MQCIAIIVIPAYATATTANLSLLLLFTAMIVNVLTLFLLLRVFYSHGERHHDSYAIQRSKTALVYLYEKVVTAKAASHHESSMPYNECIRTSRDSKYLNIPHVQEKFLSTSSTPIRVKQAFCGFAHVAQVKSKHRSINHHHRAATCSCN